MSDAIESQGTVFSIKIGRTFTVVSEMNDFNALTGSASVIDVTHLGSTAKEKLAGLQDYGQFTANFNHIPSDPGQQGLEAAKASRAKTTFRLALNDPDNTEYEFDGFVLSKPITAGVDQKVSTSVTIEITGEPTLTSDAE